MDIVSAFFDELEQEKMKGKLAEVLLRRVSTSYQRQGLDGITELIEEIRSSYVGDEDEDK